MITKSIYESVRCARHNLLHLKFFRLGYSAARGRWTCRYGNHSWELSHYPYLDFHDIEGYLFEGRLMPRPGMTVIDAGGCRGEYALFASTLVGPKGLVVMVEPDSANVAAAQRLFELNGNPPNIRVYQGGLWDRPGVVEFAGGLGDECAIVETASASQWVDRSVVSKTTIPVHSLQSLAEEFGLRSLDLVKMDVEGAEIRVIQGLADLGKQYRPAFAIASYHMVDGAQTAPQLERLFATYGYGCVTGNPRHLTTYAWPESTAQDGRR
jgi:FkbM family methyltransferase